MIELLEERRAVEVEDRIRGLAAQVGSLPLKHAVREVTVGIVVTPAIWYAADGVPAVRGLNVSPGRINMREAVFLSEEGHKVHRKYNPMRRRAGRTHWTGRSCRSRSS
jgi:type I restriction enzyme S subunit